MDTALNACGVCLRGADTGENGQEQEDEDQFWIQCDACDQWYHGSCTNVEEYFSVLLAKYHCPSCEEKHGKSIPRPQVNNSRYEFDDVDWRTKVVQIGTKDFINKFKQELIGKLEDATSYEVERVSSGKDITVESLISSGWPRPYLVSSKDGLGMSIPSNITVDTILQLLGASTLVDTIDVYRQRSYKMSLHQFYKIWTLPKSERKRLYNVISLEFSNTKLAELIRLPAVVREISWAHHIWPCPFNPVEELGLRKWNLDKTELLVDHLHLKPEVSMFCLIGMQDSFTDFHIDFGGSSVWYHVVYGEKVFIVAEPSEKNLSIFESWFSNGKRSEIYLADLLPSGSCKIVRVLAGNTLLIPSGWIHAVWTPVDSLVFGGNFLSYLHVPLQLKIHHMETLYKTDERYMFPSFEVVNWYASKHLVELLREANEDTHLADNYLYVAAEKLIHALNCWIKRDKNDRTKKHIVNNYQKTVKDLEKVWKLQHRIKNTKVKIKKTSPSKPRIKVKVPIIKCKALPPPIPPLRIPTLDVVKGHHVVKGDHVDVVKGGDVDVVKGGDVDAQVEYKQNVHLFKRKSPPSKAKRKAPKLRLKLSSGGAASPVVVPVAEVSADDLSSPIMSSDDLSPIATPQVLPLTLQIPKKEKDEKEEIKEEAKIEDLPEKKSGPVWGFSMLDLKRNIEDSKRQVSPIRIGKSSLPPPPKKEREPTGEERAPSPDFSHMFGVSSHGRVQKPTAVLCGKDDSFVYTPKVEVGHVTRDKRKYATYKQPAPVKASDFPETPFVMDEFDFNLEKPEKHSISAIKQSLKSVRSEGLNKSGGIRKGQATAKQRLASKLGKRKYLLK